MCRCCWYGVRGAMPGISRLGEALAAAFALSFCSLPSHELTKRGISLVGRFLGFETSQALISRNSALTSTSG